MLKIVVYPNLRRMRGLQCHLMLLISGVSVCAQPDNNTDLKLWFNQPAKEWNEALPVGNGRLAAMIFGNVNAERFQHNENSVWS